MERPLAERSLPGLRAGVQRAGVLLAALLAAGCASVVRQADTAWLAEAPLAPYGGPSARALTRDELSDPPGRPSEPGARRLLDQARRFMDRGDLDGALPLFVDCVRQWPASLEVTQFPRVPGALLRLKRYDDLVRICSRILAHGPPAPETWEELVLGAAIASHRAGRGEDALAFRHMAYRFMMTYPAESRFVEYLKDASGRNLTVYCRGVEREIPFYTAVQEAEMAAVHDAIARGDFVEAQARLEHRRLQFSRRLDREAAWRIWPDVAIQPGGAPMRVPFASVSAAAQGCIEACAARADDPGAALTQGLLHEFRLEYREAASAYRRCMDGPRPATGEGLGKARYRLGVCHEILDEEPGAVAAHEQNAADPNVPPIWAVRSAVSLGQWFHRRAKAIGEGAPRAAPLYARAVRSFASGANRRCSETLSDECALWVGEVLMQQAPCEGDAALRRTLYAAAADWLTGAEARLRANPARHDEALYWLGVAHLRTGEAAKARKTWTRLVGLGRKSSWERFARERLSELR